MLLIATTFPIDVSIASLCQVGYTSLRALGGRPWNLVNVC